VSRTEFPVTGKNTGNFVDSAVFCDNPPRKHLRIQ
jgi:hypothetical protein